jgi:hypothetical protein
VTSREEKEKHKKGKFYFSVGTSYRKYLIYTDSEDAMKGWIERINRSIQGTSGGNGGSAAPSGPATTTSAGSAAPASKPDTSSGDDTKPSSPEPQASEPRRVDAPSGGSPRAQISKAKEVIPFLQDEESKVLEFWQIWSESIPPREELQPSLTIEYHVSTSANMQKLTWRTGMSRSLQFTHQFLDILG